MKLSRRGIFGVGAGAALAGPSMAKEAMADLGVKMAGTPAVGGYPNTACTPVEDPNWFARRREDLERQVRGEFGEEHPHEGIGAFVGDPGMDRIDGLRSVSTPVRRLMANDLAKRRERERRMEFAAWELRELFKNYGPKW